MSLLQEHQRNGDIRMVQRGQIQAMSWTEMKAIGSDNMASDIAVIIATDLSVVVARIPRRASLLPENSPYAGENYVELMMDRVHQLYCHPEYFPFPTETQAAVCAWVHEDAPAEQEYAILRCITDMGLYPVHMRLPVYVNGETNGVTSGGTNATTNDTTNGATNGVMNGVSNGATDATTHTQPGEGECLVLRGQGGSPRIYADDNFLRPHRRSLLQET